MSSSKLIIALDNLSESEAHLKIQEVSAECSEYMDRILFKVNDLLTLKGLEGVKKMIEGTGARMMLDPKWHDIPKTLQNNVQKLFDSGLAENSDYVTIHASNGFEGCKAVVDKKSELGLSTKVLAVTALTSLGEEGVQKVFDKTAKHAVLSLAGEALRAGVDGIVCSPLEVDVLREVYGEEFVIVNPGVRFADGDNHDQKRVLTPAKTIQNGSTDIVMGRPILESKDIKTAIERFFQEIEGETYKGSMNNYDFEKILYTGEWKEILSYIGAFYFRPEGGKYCRFTSKVISNAYINIGAIERNYLVIDRATSELADKIRDASIEADMVVGAQMGSVRISLALAEKLGIEQSIYTEKTDNDNNNMDLKRHAVDLTGKRIILSEDIVSRGTTIAKMKRILEGLGGEVVAIACVGNRFEQESQDGIPIISCFVPPKFELYWDDDTPGDQRKDFPKIPDGAKIAEKPKNQWGELVESMRN